MITVRRPHVLHNETHDRKHVRVSHMQCYYHIIFFPILLGYTSSCRLQLQCTFLQMKSFGTNNTGSSRRTSSLNSDFSQSCADGED